MSSWSLFFLLQLPLPCFALLFLLLQKIFLRAKSISPGVPSSMIFMLMLFASWLVLIAIAGCVISIAAWNLHPIAQNIAVGSAILALVMLSGMAVMASFWRRSKQGPPRFFHAINVPTPAIVDAASSVFQKLNLPIETKKKFLQIDLRSEKGTLSIPNRGARSVFADKQLHQRHPEFITKLMEEIVSRDASVALVGDSVDSFKRDFVFTHCVMMIVVAGIWLMKYLDEKPPRAPTQSKARIEPREDRESSTH